MQSTLSGCVWQFWKLHGRIPKMHQAKVIGIVALLTIGSVIMAAAKLETEFDLTDFLDEDMDVMQGREALYDSYDAAGWKPFTS